MSAETTTEKTITDESANANDNGSAARNTAGPDKVQTIPGKIRALFREAVQALFGRDDDEPQPQRRGKEEGERDGGLMRCALRFAKQLGAKARLIANAELRDDFRATALALAQAEEAEDFFKKPGASSTDLHDFANPFFSRDTIYIYEPDEHYVEQQDYYSLNL